MRAVGKVFVIVSLAIAGIGIAEGQPPLQIQPGGLFGGKGGDYFSLLKNAQIKTELKVTDEQTNKLPAAALKALGEVLNDQQLKRLRQIYLQQRGHEVFLETDVRKDLKITDEQAKKIQAAIDTQAKEFQDMVQGGNLDIERFRELQKTAIDTVQGTLTAEQKSAWTKMIGEPFQMKGIGKGGFGKKGR